MPVAKSYKDLPRLCEPFEAKGKMYVKVQTKKGAEKIVRWYTNQEYNKMYPEVKIEEYKRIRPYKEVLGFDKGYVTIFKGDTYSNLEYFQLSNARYCKMWGWYIVSTEEVPADLPIDVTPIQLKWEDVCDESGEGLKNDTAIKEVVESLIYDKSESEFIGEVGDRLDFTLTVNKIIPFENYFGHSNMYIFNDESGNEFVWTTSAKTLTLGKTYQVRGSIKEHKMYRNSAQNVLTRCAVKE